MLIEESHFKGLDSLDQERLFAPCCLSREQLWTSGTEWSEDEIDNIVIEPALRRLGEATDESVRSMTRRLGYERERELVRKELLEGDDFAVEFLMWFLEQSMPEVHCSTESKNNDQEPDLIVSHSGVKSCKIELKRIVSTSNLVDYTKRFIGKSWQQRSSTRPSVLLLIFPLLSADSWRVRTLTEAYMGFCQEVSDWHDRSMYAYSVTAPLNPRDGANNLPLNQIKEFVGDHVP